MSQEKADIFLERLIKRIDNGEFDARLNIPFATKKLLKKVVKKEKEEVL